MQTRSLAEVVGRNARQLRSEHGATLDAVASTARSYGLRWSTARVVEFEKGRLPLSASLLLVVAHVIGHVTGKTISLSDLVRGDDWVELTDSFTISGHAVEEAFSGEALRWSLSDTKSSADAVATLILGLDDLAEAVERYLPKDTSFGELSDTHPPTLAETRAAKRLELPSWVVSWWARRLWGHSLDEESAQRAGKDASAQLRGSITRQLVAEIRDQAHG